MKMDDQDLRRLKASLQLFDKLNCCSSSLNENLNEVYAALALAEEDKMRCHIINCLIALTLIQTEKGKNEVADSADDDNYKMVKGKVFNAAISMILDEKLNSNEAVVKTILTGFPFRF
jgi:hypothetical protein